MKKIRYGRNGCTPRDQLAKDVGYIDRAYLEVFAAFSTEDESELVKSICALANSVDIVRRRLPSWEQIVEEESERREIEAEKKRVREERQEKLQRLREASLRRARGLFRRKGK